LDHFSGLIKKNNACTVQVALHAARSGNQVLTKEAEDLHRASKESAQQVKQICGELKDVRNTWSEVETALNGNLKRLTSAQDAAKEARKSLEAVLHSLMQSKETIEEIASTAHRQSSSIENIRQNQNGIIDELTKSISKSSGAESDTRIQTENLHDLDSLAKKLVCMVDRLNVLSLQFKV